MTAAPVRRAPKRAAQRPPESRASLQGALRRSCRAASSPVGVARNGGNLSCRSVGGLWTASATQSARRPWAHRGMDEESVRTYTSAATRPMRATLTRAACSTAASIHVTSRFGRPVAHAPAGATKDRPVVVRLDELAPVGRWAASGRERRRFDRFSQMCENLPDRPWLRDERDEPDVTAARWALQRKLLAHPGHELGPGDP